ncbi:MAG TPA: dephospho-CoA kinase [Nitrospiraceae bacterium]|nr:dephospho-CoA kinase [Nitrospiraceae bacterium]
MLSSGMLLIGLTGGVATGKSTVARLFKICGAVIIDADDLARQVVQPGKPAWRDIVRLYGEQVLESDRTLNRPALAKIVFRDPRKLRALGGIIHPRVAREQSRLARNIARKCPSALIVYDVPLLFEAGVDKRVDRIVVVAADRKTQITRLQQRNHLTRAEALRRIRSQMPLAQKMKRADYVIDGTLPLFQLKRAVNVVYATLRKEMNGH